LISLKEIKNSIFSKENFYFLIIILLTFSIDRYSKIKIINNFSDTSFYLNDFLNLDLLWNTGIGFGLLSLESSIYYNFLSILIGLVIVLLIFVGIKSNKFEKFFFSMIIGGALGNFYDRIYFNAVPDFIDLHYKNFHWFTFNLADIFITIGIIFYIFNGVLINRSK
tara:strand:- start:42 stop:539 length:498 start_codon:yes stop_codon:yes gene_type:complete